MHTRHIRPKHVHSYPKQHTLFSEFGSSIICYSILIALNSLFRILSFAHAWISVLMRSQDLKEFWTHSHVQRTCVNAVMWISSHLRLSPDSSAHAHAIPYGGFDTKALFFDSLLIISVLSLIFECICTCISTRRIRYQLKSLLQGPMIACLMLCLPAVAHASPHGGCGAWVDAVVQSSSTPMTILADFMHQSISDGGIVKCVHDIKAAEHFSLVANITVCLWRTCDLWHTQLCMLFACSGTWSRTFLWWPMSQGRLLMLIWCLFRNAPFMPYCTCSRNFSS